MKLKSVEIENYRAIEKLRLPLDPALTVFHGDNAHGKTSILSAIAVGLGSIPTLLPDVSGIGFLETGSTSRATLAGKTHNRRWNYMATNQRAAGTACCPARTE